MKRFKNANVIWFVAYLAVITGIVLWMFHTRARVRAQFSDQQVQADWQTWRDDVREQQAPQDAENPPPVARRVPKSVVPPLFVLMEDYFVTLLVSAVLAGTILFGLLIFTIRGALARVELPQDPSLEENAPPGEV